MAKETSMDMLADNYVNWKAIVEDYNLKSGDLTIEQDIALNNIIKSFIMQNMNEWRNNDL
jgi:ribosome-interacting GTPase 1|tara:strand:+ start:918 stop:1097 length:180 start_codon:yes stop_codon:yes gene_type:complete